MRGRGTRRADHIKKTGFTMFDFVGLTDFHGDSEDMPEGEVIYVPAPARPPGTPRRLLVLDVDDHIDPASRGWVGLNEDGDEYLYKAAEARSLELGLRFEDWLLAQESLTADQLRLLRMIGEQIKANAGSMERFETYRLVNPPFSLGGGLDRAVRVFGATERLEKVLNDINAAVFDDEE